VLNAQTPNYGFRYVHIINKYFQPYSLVPRLAGSHDYTGDSRGANNYLSIPIYVGIAVSGAIYLLKCRIIRILGIHPGCAIDRIYHFASLQVNEK
jgi:hypothetical protein